VPGPWTSGPPATGGGGEREVAGGDWGWIRDREDDDAAGEREAAACASLGRRFWARRVGFSARWGAGEVICVLHRIAFF